MPISKPTLPPRKGYVEVEVNGVPRYRNISTGVLLEDEKILKPAEPVQTSIDLLADAYRDGVNES